MTKLFVIGAGGFIGAVLRYLVSGWVHRLADSYNFPYGTLAVNLIGCLFIGACSQLDELHAVFAPQWRIFLFIGLFGAFTTYSTFGNETYNLMADRRLLPALANVAIHVVFGLAAVWAGRVAVHALWR